MEFTRGEGSLNLAGADFIHISFATLSAVTVQDAACYRCNSIAAVPVGR
jgi:hypothetical protein